MPNKRASAASNSSFRNLRRWGVCCCCETEPWLTVVSNSALFLPLLVLACVTKDDTKGMDIDRAIKGKTGADASACASGKAAGTVPVLVFLLRCPVAPKDFGMFDFSMLPVVSGDTEPARVSLKTKTSFAIDDWTTGKAAVLVLVMVMVIVIPGRNADRWS